MESEHNTFYIFYERHIWISSRYLRWTVLILALYLDLIDLLLILRFLSDPLLLVQRPILPPTLLRRTRLLLPLDVGNDSSATVRAFFQRLQPISQHLPGYLSILRPRPRLLHLDHDARLVVLELDGGIGFVDFLPTWSTAFEERLADFRVVWWFGSWGHMF